MRSTNLIAPRTLSLFSLGSYVFYFFSTHRFDQALLIGEPSLVYLTPSIHWSASIDICAINQSDLPEFLSTSLFEQTLRGGQASRGYGTFLTIGRVSLNSLMLGKHFFLNLLLELALKHCLWRETNKSENFKLIFFTCVKIFSFTFFPFF
jgi:hypothetical protein